MKNNRRIKITAFMLVLCMMISILPGNVIALTDDSAESAETEQAVTPTTEEKSLADEILEPIIVSEDITKRGEKEKHFLCDDGSYIAVSYPQAVHEQIDGEWVDIEYDVTADGNGISPVDDTIKVKFANNTNSAKLVKLESGDYKISWTVEAENENGDITEKVKLSKDSKATVKTTKEITQENKEKIKNEAKYTKEEVKSLKKQTKEKIKKLELAKTANIEQHKDVVSANVVIEDHNREYIQSISFAQSNVEYVGAFGEGTTLRYVMSQGKINEEIVLESYNGFKSYSMVIDTDGLTPVKTETGRVDLTDENGENFLTIAPPYMYDSADKISQAVEVTVTQESKKEWRITYTPDSEWLTDIDRVYPIVIDPVATTIENAQTNQLDTYVYEGQIAPVNNSGPYLYVGNKISESNEKTEYISYWGQNVFLPYVENGIDSIVDISFNIRIVEGTTGIGRIQLFDAEYDGDTSAFTWNNKPDLITSLGAILSLPDNNWLKYSNTTFESELLYKYDNSIPIIMMGLKETVPSGRNEPTCLYSTDYRPNGSLSYIPYIAITYTGIETGGGDDSGGSDSGNEEITYPSGHTTAFPSGTYIIENMYNGRYLHHTEDNHTVNVWTYSEQPYQQWYLKLNSDGTYSFIPWNNSANEYTDLKYYMEIYCGADEATQPITTYDYVSEYNTESPHCRFYILQNNDGTYSIMPKKYHTKVLEVYKENNDSVYYSNTYSGGVRKFDKIKGQSVQLNTYTGESNQRWKIHLESSFSWDTSLAPGIYYIENSRFHEYLTHDSTDNTVKVTSKEYGLSQQWEVTLYSGDIYHFTPKSNNDFNLELYHATWNGACNEGHPITVSDYSSNQGSPYIMMRLKRNEDGSYKIFPIVTPTKCLDVYTGATSSQIYNGRVFDKHDCEFVQLGLADNGTKQNWTFSQVLGNPIDYTLPDYLIDDICVLRALINKTKYGSNSLSAAAINEVLYDLYEQENLIRADYILEGNNYLSPYAQALIPNIEAFWGATYEQRQQYSSIYKIVVNRLLVLFGIESEANISGVYCLDIDRDFSVWDEESEAARASFLSYTIDEGGLFDRAESNVMASERTYSKIQKLSLWRYYHDEVKRFVANNLEAKTEVMIPKGSYYSETGPGYADIMKKESDTLSYIWEVKPNKPMYYCSVYGTTVIKGRGTKQLEKYISAANLSSLGAIKKQDETGITVFNKIYKAGYALSQFNLLLSTGQVLEISSPKYSPLVEPDNGLVLYNQKEGTNDSEQYYKIDQLGIDLLQSFTPVITYQNATATSTALVVTQVVGGVSIGTFIVLMATPTASVAVTAVIAGTATSEMLSTAVAAIETKKAIILPLTSPYVVEQATEFVNYWGNAA